MRIGEQTQEAGIGSYCWASPGPAAALCVDTLGIPTVGESLTIVSPFVARFEFQIPDSPASARLTVHPVTAGQASPPGMAGTRAWPPNPGESFVLPLTGKPALERKLDLDPGLYALSVFVVWEDLGDVFYGFLVEAPGEAAGRESLAGFERKLMGAIAGQDIGILAGLMVRSQAGETWNAKTLRPGRGGLR